MQTATAIGIPAYNPNDPYHHVKNIEIAIWDLPLTIEQRRSLFDLLSLAQREAFIRGMNPDRLVGY